MDPLAILAIRRSEPEPPHMRHHLWPFIILMLVLLAIAVATLQQPPAPAATTTPTPTESDVVQREARVYSVSYRFGVFSPTNLRIHVGDTVRWKNDSPLPIRITAQLEMNQKIPAFDSVGTVEPGSYFSYTFSTAGTFGYGNASNSNESGVIIVR